MKLIFLSILYFFNNPTTALIKPPIKPNIAAKNNSAIVELELNIFKYLYVYKNLMSGVKFKKRLKKIWFFIWEDDSWLSWIVNVVLAFILVKFIIYPGLGLLLGTNLPIVAVVSGSMEHNGLDFNSWWDNKGELYANLNITKEEFSDYKFKNGFNKGDLMILVNADNLKMGDSLVFAGNAPGPIIHRIVKIDRQGNNIFVQTMGDNNTGSRPDEFGITKDKIFGKALLRIPYLGWFKLGFLKLIGLA